MRGGANNWRNFNFNWILVAHKSNICISSPPLNVALMNCSQQTNGATNMATLLQKNCIKTLSVNNGVVTVGTAVPTAGKISIEFPLYSHLYLIDFWFRFVLFFFLCRFSLLGCVGFIRFFLRFVLKHHRQRQLICSQWLLMRHTFNHYKHFNINNYRRCKPSHSISSIIQTMAHYFGQLQPLHKQLSPSKSTKNDSQFLSNASNT